MKLKKVLDVAAVDHASDGFRRGVRNLLESCLKARAGQRLQIFHEPADGSFYSSELPAAVASEAEEYGLHTQLAMLPVVEDVASLTDEAFAPASNADHILFLSRCGDQLRFQDQPLLSRSAICYAMTETMMASSFAGTPHDLMIAVKKSVDDALNGAKHILIECPLGTRVEGRSEPRFNNEPGDTQISRFPLSVCQPIPASAFSGTVVIPDFLVGTGSRYFTPFAAELSQPLFASFDRGRITRFEGRSEDVAAANLLYHDVATRYSIDPDVVHSWHAGIHPQLSYDMRADANYERWSGAAFGNPRILHFHTCGAYAPGEISWNVIDATVTVDNAVIWKNGRLLPHALPDSAALRDNFPLLESVFSEPATNIGLR